MPFERRKNAKKQRAGTAGSTARWSHGRAVAQETRDDERVELDAEPMIEEPDGATRTPIFKGEGIAVAA